MQNSNEMNYSLFPLLNNIIIINLNLLKNLIKKTKNINCNCVILMD